MVQQLEQDRLGLLREMVEGERRMEAERTSSRRRVEQLRAEAWREERPLREQRHRAACCQQALVSELRAVLRQTEALKKEAAARYQLRAPPYLRSALCGEGYTPPRSPDCSPSSRRRRSPPTSPQNGSSSSSRRLVCPKKATSPRSSVTKLSETASPRSSIARQSEAASPRGSLARLSEATSPRGSVARLSEARSDRPKPADENARHVDAYVRHMLAYSRRARLSEPGGCAPQPPARPAGGGPARS